MQTLKRTETPAPPRRQQMKPKASRKTPSVAMMELNADEIISISLRRRELANKLEDTRQARGMLQSKISHLAASLSNPDADVEEELSALRARLKAIAGEEAEATAALAAFDESHLSDEQLQERADAIERRQVKERNEKIVADFKALIEGAAADADAQELKLLAAYDLIDKNKSAFTNGAAALSLVQMQQDWVAIKGQRPPASVGITPVIAEWLTKF